MWSLEVEARGYGNVDSSRALLFDPSGVELSVDLTAIPAGGSGFHKWEIVSGAPIITDPTSSSTTVEITGKEQGVRAVFVLNDLLACWDFDSTSGNVFFDVGGNGHHLRDIEETGLQTVSGVRGNALQCNNKGFVLVADFSDSAFTIPEFTIEAWIYFDEPPSAYNPTGQMKLLSHETINHGGLSQGYSLYLKDDGKPGLTLARVEGAGHFIGALSQDVLVVSEWHHVAGTYDGETIRVYSDGVPVAETAYSGGYETPQEDAAIACQTRFNEPPESRFGGFLDELKIYRRALDSTEVRLLFERNTPP